MPKQINIMVIVLFLVLGLFSLSFSQESMTITTYYPSPYGSYNELQFYPHAAPATPCNNNTRGTMYYDSDDNQIYVCDGSSYVTIGGFDCSACGVGHSCWEAYTAGNTNFEHCGSICTPAGWRQLAPCGSYY